MGSDSVSTGSGGRDASPDFAADVDIELTALMDNVPILSGSETTVMRYNGSLIAGDASRLVNLPDNYLGPVITVRKGENVRVRLVNSLTEETILHWHGLRVPEHADGHPRLAISPGETYVYEFTVIDPAGTYWFHPHTHGRTGYQAYYGMAGLFVIKDDAEEALGLPSGAYDLPVIIQDRSFTSSNQLSYDTGGGMMGGMAGFFGDRILVNGAVNASLSLEANSYRLRLLNGSNARVYKLAWNDGTAVTVIGTDGGLLPAPLTKEYVTLAPGERIDLFVDLSGRAIGSEIRLVSLSYDGDAFGSNMGGMSGSAPAISIGSEFAVMSVSVERVASSSPATLSASLIPMVGYSLEEASNSSSPRSFSLYMQHGSWTMNGRTFEMDAVADDEIVRFGDTEVWEYINRSGQAVAHPMHMHEARFQVLDREQDGSWRSAYATVSDGFVDGGWKDTALVMPGEKVTVILKFDSYSGLFLNHCHNLEHHDNGMMRNFRIE